jgi:hypothetical protein
MSEYDPDRWVVLEITQNQKSIRRVLAGWRDKFLGASNYRLSSPVVKVLDMDKYYRVVTKTGNVYCCHKECEGMNVITARVVSSLSKQLEGKGSVDFVTLGS